MDEVLPEEGWSPIRPEIVKVNNEEKPQIDEIIDFQTGIENGRYIPVPEPAYIWIQKHLNKKIVNTSRGIHKEYDFWELKRQLTNEDRKLKRSENHEIPEKCKLYIEYREDGQVHLFLRKTDLGKSWTAAECITKIKE